MYQSEGSTFHLSPSPFHGLSFLASPFFTSYLRFLVGIAVDQEFLLVGPGLGDQVFVPAQLHQGVIQRLIVLDQL